jgi:hypothetical protein
VLSEAGRVVAPGGLVLCYEPRIPNPLNRHTRLVRDRDFDAAGLVPCRQARLTLNPPIARRLGPLTKAAYPRLARVPWLRTHRLVELRPVSGPT